MIVEILQLGSERVGALFEKKNPSGLDFFMISYNCMVFIFSWIYSDHARDFQNVCILRCIAKLATALIHTDSGTLLRYVYILHLQSLLLRYLE